MLKQNPELLRERFSIAKKHGNQIVVKNKKLINFCGNDYLALSSHTAIAKAFIDGVKHYGLGSCASSLVSGYYRAHQLLEEKFAEFLQCEKTLLFGSGYHANIGIIRTLVNRQDTIIADKYCHASILDGIQLSLARCNRYLHNNLEHLTNIISASKSNKLLITESIFSMEGSITPVDDIAHIAKTNNIPILVDDAHGIGVLGENGRGIIEHQNIKINDLTCLVAPLGKAFAGMGAIVAGNKAMIDNVMQFAKSYCYSTALPPAIAHAMIKSLMIVEKETWRRQKLQYLIQFFLNEAKKHALRLISNDPTPIKSILIGDNVLTAKIKNQLYSKGYFIACIRPPTVPIGTTRIRISLNCMHTEKDISQMLNHIAEAYEKFK